MVIVSEMGFQMSRHFKPVFLFDHFPAVFDAISWIPHDTDTDTDLQKHVLPFWLCLSVMINDISIQALA